MNEPIKTNLVAPADLARVSAVIGMSAALRSNDHLHGEAHVDQVAVGGDVHGLQVVK